MRDVMLLADKNSNTYYQEASGLEIVDVSPLFAEAIYRAQKGLSISRLFK